MPRTRDDQWRAPPLKYENNRDDRLDELIANTKEQGRWCVDFDPFRDHDPKVMKEWFVYSEHQKGEPESIHCIRRRRASDKV